ncbi:nitrilase [Metarhizium brunneum]
MPVIRVGTASPATGPTKAATLRHLSDLARRAAAQSIDILLLPEAYIGGYPRGTAFGAVIGDRPYEGREEFARYFDQAADLGDTVGGGAGAGARWVKRELGGDDDLPRGDGTREELEKIASDTGVFIVTGIIEKTGGSLYCAVVYVCPKAGIIGKRRKVMPTGTERLCWAQGSPATLKAVSTVIRGQRVNIGAAICWENYMPFVRQALYEQNINLYLAPTADGRDAWMGLMRTVGVEGRCFVVSSNMAVRKDGSAQVASSQPSPTRARARRSSTFTDQGFEIALPSVSPTRRRRRKSVFDEDGNEIVLGCDESNGAEKNGTSPGAQPKSTVATADGWVSRGGSSIVNPFGDVLAGPQWEDDEGLIFADIDLRECIRGRLDLDTAGHYSRNDSFKFTVAGLDLDPLPY